MIEETEEMGENGKVCLMELGMVQEAQLCRAKAIDWRTRNPSNPAHLQLHLESLIRMKYAYHVYGTQLAHRSKLQKPTKSWDSVKADYEKAERELVEAKDKNVPEDQLRFKEREVHSRKPLNDALKKVEDARRQHTTAVEVDRVAKAGSDENAKIIAKVALKPAEEKLEQLNDDAAETENRGAARAEHEF
ncbi:MAG: hypothetical protein Q9222_006455 [Ikaeria aurantiellina]